MGRILAGGLGLQLVIGCLYVSTGKDGPRDFAVISAVLTF